MVFEAPNSIKKAFRYLLISGGIVPSEHGDMGSESKHQGC